MRAHDRLDFLAPATMILIGLPLLIWAMGDFPRRTLLKDSLSLLTLLAFGLMLGQFYLARSYAGAMRSLGAGSILKIHKFVGYTFVGILLVHPFFIVLPRFFESGVDPLAALVTLVTTFDSPGVVLGLAAWCLMVILGVTSLFRDRLPLKYRTWRILHGVLSVVFIALATWHAIDLGRHTDTFMSAWMILLAAGGVVLLLKRYLGKTPVRREHSHG